LVSYVYLHEGMTLKISLSITKMSCFPVTYFSNLIYRIIGVVVAEV